MNENTGLAVQVIENATRDDVRAGDYVIWETVENYDGITVTVRRQGIARRRNDYGDWCSEGGAWLTGLEGDDITLTIHRPVPVEREPGR